MIARLETLLPEPDSPTTPSVSPRRSENDNSDTAWTIPSRLDLPKASPTPLPELDTFLAPFAPLFRRHTSRDSLERYVTGLLTDLPHKTADTIAAAVAGTSTERLQHLLTDAAWDALALDEARVKRLLSIHPPSAGVLVFDDPTPADRPTVTRRVEREALTASET